MKSVSTLSLLAMAFAASPARASDFRFCDMEGSVESAVLRPGNKARVFELVVGVSSAQPDKRATLNYTDCSEYVGRTIMIRLQVPKRYGKPSPGDFISFGYSAVDGFDANGDFAGTSINVSLHSYRGASRDGR